MPNPKKQRPLSRGELLKIAINALGISEESLKKTDIKLHETENDMLCTVTVETDAGDVYKLVAEAYSGTLMKVELNGAEIEIGIESIK